MPLGAHHNQVYDCVNAVATVGSTSSFNTLTFTPDMTFTGNQVTTRGGAEASPHACPSKPSDMNTLVANSTIRMISINIGDSTGSDTGVSGYFDKAVLNKDSDGINTYDFEALPPDTSSTTFVSDPKYVRANNGADLAAQIVTPDETQDVRFYIDGNMSAPFAGVNVGGAGATTSWWRLYTPLSAGEHSISVQVKISGHWYDVTDTAIVYSLDGPWAEYVIPQPNKYFRANDKVVRVKADDEFNQFDRMVTTINSVSHTVNRAQCTDQGSYVLAICRISTCQREPFQAKTTTYTKANNRVDNLMSPAFIIDNTRPELTKFQITDVHSVYGADVPVSADATDANGIKDVSFYVTAPRAGDGACDGNGTHLADADGSNISGDTYSATLNTGSLNGEYCVNAIAGDVPRITARQTSYKIVLITHPRRALMISPANNSIVDASTPIANDWMM